MNVRINVNVNMAQYTLSQKIISSGDPLIPDIIELTLLDAQGNELKKGNILVDSGASKQEIIDKAQENGEKMALAYEEEQSAEKLAERQTVEDTNNSIQDAVSALGKTFSVTV